MEDNKKQAVVQALRVYNETAEDKLEFDEVWKVIQHRALCPEPRMMLERIRTWFKPTTPQPFECRFCESCHINKPVWRWSPGCPHVACETCCIKEIRSTVEQGFILICPMCGVLADPRVLRHCQVS